jgi:hypothetical protein
MSLAWELNDKTTELRAYDNLSVEYYYSGDIENSKVFRERCIKGLIEKPDSHQKIANKLINKYNRKYKPKKYKFDQLGLKGLDKPDISKKPDFGKSNNFELLPHDFKD